MLTWLAIRRPDRYVFHLSHIDFAELVITHGVRYLIVDVDNTVRPAQREDDQPEFDEQAVATLKQLLADGPIEAICLLSNVVFRSRARSARIRRLAELIGTEYIVECHWRLFGSQLKPTPWGFHRALDLLRASRDETAVIGDQLFTDIAGAKRLGLHAILVRPLSQDHWYTAWKRLPEQFFLNLIWPDLSEPVQLERKP